MKIGVDIGGTTVKIGFVKDNLLLDHFQIPTKKESLFVDIALAIKSYIKSKNINDIEMIGFGIPGNVKNNYIYNMPNIGIKDIDINQAIGSYFPSVKIFSNNDANIAALAEAYHNNFKSSYMITLGTGVGGGLVLDHKLIDGCHNACGEVGHLFVDYKHNFQCTCGLCGCLETVASATGVVRLAKYYYNKYNTVLPISMTCKDVFDKAKENDPLGLFVVDYVSKALARGLASLAVSIDVEAFIIGGGVSACGDILLELVKKYFKEYSHYAVKNTPIIYAKLGNLAGMLGAAMLS